VICEANKVVFCFLGCSKEGYQIQDSRTGALKPDNYFKHLMKKHGLGPAKEKPKDCMPVLNSSPHLSPMLNSDAENAKELVDKVNPQCSESPSSLETSPPLPDSAADSTQFSGNTDDFDSVDNFIRDCLNNNKC
jgi:hypothetical protein